eukprot:365278-Chlamydomonas_euryale.AAC.5
MMLAYTSSSVGPLPADVPALGKLVSPSRSTPPLLRLRPADGCAAADGAGGTAAALGAHVPPCWDVAAEAGAVVTLADAMPASPPPPADVAAAAAGSLGCGA